MARGEYEIVIDNGRVIPRILPANAESEVNSNSNEDGHVLNIGTDIELRPNTPQFRVAARLATYVKATEARFRNRWVPKQEGDQLLSAKHRLALLGVPPHKVNIAFVPQEEFSAEAMTALEDDTLRFEHVLNLKRLNEALAPKATPTGSTQERSQIVYFPTLRTE